jgi:hypothetical protein
MKEENLFFLFTIGFLLKKVNFNVGVVHLPNKFEALSFLKLSYQRERKREREKEKVNFKVKTVILLL